MHYRNTVSVYLMACQYLLDFNTVLWNPFVFSYLFFIVCLHNWKVIESTKQTSFYETRFKL